MAWQKVKQIMSGMAETLPSVPEWPQPKLPSAALLAALSTQDFHSAMTRHLSNWATSALGTVPTAYDKALDAVYNASHIGGKYHRLFDGSHDPFGAWQTITKEGLGSDLFDRIGGYTTALTKDFVTTMGIPFTTIDKVSFDKAVDMWSVIPGIDRDYLCRLLSLNGADLISATIAAVGTVLAFRGENLAHFSELVGSLGVSTIASANPLLAIVTIVSAGYAFSRDQLSLAGMATGAGAAAMSLLLYAVISLPLLVELVVVTAIVTIVKVNLFENTELHDYLLGGLSECFAALKILPKGA